MLKEAGAARMILISSVAGGPTALRSGTIYAMTKGTFCFLVPTTVKICCEHCRVAAGSHRLSASYWGSTVCVLQLP